MGLTNDGNRSRATADDIKGKARIPIFLESHLQRGFGGPSLFVIEGDDWKVLETTGSGEWPRAVVDKVTGNYLVHTFPKFDHDFYEVDILYDVDDGMFIAYYGARGSVVASVPSTAHRLTYEEMTVADLPGPEEPPLLIADEWSTDSETRLWGRASAVKRVDNLTLDLAVGESPFKWSKALEDGADAVIEELGLPRSRERRRSGNEPRGNTERGEKLHSKFKDWF